MRTLIDALCAGCGDVHVDVWVDTRTPEIGRCRRCQGPLVRHYAPAVRPDSIPGGLLIEHGLCHENGSPRRFDSHSALARAARAKGLRNIVEHVPEQGSDKSPHTTRWL